MGTSVNQATSSALVLLSQNYQEAMNYEEELHNLLDPTKGTGVVTLDGKIASEEESDHYYDHYPSRVGKHGQHTSAYKTLNTTDEKDLSNNKAELATISAKAETIAKELNKIDPCCSVILGMIGNMVTGSISFATSTATNNVSLAFGSFKQHTAKYLAALFSALKEQLISDGMNEQIQKMIETSGDTQNLSQEISQLRMAMLHADNEENGAISALQNELVSDTSTFVSKDNNAKLDAESYRNTVWKSIAGWWWGYGDAHRSEDKQIETASKAMLHAIRKELNLLPKVEALVDSHQFSMIEQDLQMILQKILKIIEDPNLSYQAKVEKVVALTMFALQLVGVLQSIMQNQKSGNEQKIAEASLRASQQNVQTTQTNEILLQNALDQQSELKWFKLAITIVGGLVCSIMGGVSGFIVMATMTVLSATGVMNKLATDLGNAIHNKTAADWIITIATIVISVVAGGCLDAGLSRFATRAVSQAASKAIEVTDEAIAKTVDEAVQAATSSGVQNVDKKAVEEVVDKAVYQAAKEAAQEAKRTFFDQPLPALGALLARKGFKKALIEAMEKAATKAAEEAVQLVKPLAEEVATNGITPTTDQAIGAIARKAFLKATGEGAASKLFGFIDNKLGNQPSKLLNSIDDRLGNKPSRLLNRLGSSALSRTLTRASMAMSFGLGSTNYLLDKEETKKEREQDPSIWLSILQDLMVLQAMIGMMGSGAITTELGANLMRVQSFGNVLTQAMGAGSNFAMAKTYDLQADATTGLKMTSALGDLLHMIWKQIHDQSGEDIRNYLDLQREENQENNQIALHIYDGERAGIEILTSQAV